VISLYGCDKVEDDVEFVKYRKSSFVIRLLLERNADVAQQAVIVAMAMSESQLTTQTCRDFLCCCSS